MQYTASDFRAMARQTLKGKWGIAILVTVVATILGVETAADYMISFKFEAERGMLLEMPFITYPLLRMEYGILKWCAIIASIWRIIKLILAAPLTLGYYHFHQKIVRKEKEQVKDLFVSMKNWGRSLEVVYLQVFYIMLGVLCLVVPGIMATYSYAMTCYIAMDYPQMSANEAIAASKKMMKGNRWRLFCLEISFIGWEILGLLTLGAGACAVGPYRETARAFFYQDLCEKKKEQETVWDVVTDKYNNYKVC